jgi:GNAT superfamily N-acetyltransferase
MSISIKTDPFPSNAELEALWIAVWDEHPNRDFAHILARSLAHVGAYDGDRLIGFVNIAWDGGIHAFLLDTSVHPDWRRRGIATEMVRQAISVAQLRGAKWLHVDFESHLKAFYAACGFRHTAAGLIDLEEN